MTKTTKLPRLTRPMTKHEERLLRHVLERLDHLSSLARVNLEGERRQGRHAARAAMYLRSAVREASGLLRELAPQIAAEEAYQKEPLTPQQRGRIDARTARAA